MEEILRFLDDVLHNNNRPWFQEHKNQFLKAQANFNALAEQIIDGVQKFDDNCKGLTLKDCTYRFYRDTRFSPDKRPYKTHFGVFVCPEGKKSMLAGYYFHLEAKESVYARQRHAEDPPRRNSFQRRAFGEEHCRGQYLRLGHWSCHEARAQRLPERPPTSRIVQAARLALGARPP